MGEVIDIKAFAEKKKNALQKAEAFIVDNAKHVLDAMEGALSEKAAEASTVVTDVTEVVKQQEKLMEMLIHDLEILARKVMQMESMHVNTASTASTIATLMVEKGLATEAEFQAIWDRDVVPQLVKAGLMQDPRDEVKTPGKIIMPETPKIVVP